MIYVMGLEAAKTRPANEKERAEMARLLHEGMDAGLCGFSIQRLGPDSVQADFDGSPMVTDTRRPMACVAAAWRTRAATSSRIRSRTALPSKSRWSFIDTRRESV